MVLATTRARGRAGAARRAAARHRTRRQMAEDACGRQPNPPDQCRGTPEDVHAAIDRVTLQATPTPTPTPTQETATVRNVRLPWEAKRKVKGPRNARTWTSHGGPHTDFEPWDDAPPDPEDVLDDASHTRVRRDSYGYGLKLAHVIREFGLDYLDHARRKGVPEDLLTRQERVLRDLMGCRTAAMGEHAWRCRECGELFVYFNSCGNRHCPQCREHHRRQWAERLESDLLPVEYHHVILTLPRQVTQLVMAHGDVLYSIVMQAGGQGILQVGTTLLSAQLAAMIMLHTWGQILNDHVHLHGLVPACGIHLDTGAVVRFPKRGEFLSLSELSRAFRDLLIDALVQAHASGKLRLTGQWQRLASPEAFQAWLAPLRRIHWQVRHRAVWNPRNVAKQDKNNTNAAVAPVNSVVGYLARYANRVVIANSRLVGMEDGKVVFSYKDYRDNSRWKRMAMTGVEFIERFLQHMLPRGLHNKRRYGFWAYGVRTKNMALIRAQLGVDAPSSDVPTNAKNKDDEANDASECSDGERARHCAVCKSVLEYLGGTHRPTVPTIMDMVWSDMQRALDVRPNSYTVRTYQDLARKEARKEARRRRREQREQRERGGRREQRGRGPPPNLETAWDSDACSLVT